MALQLGFTVVPQADGMRLDTFLRSCGLTAGCIRSVKHQSNGFFADGKPLHTNQPVAAGQRITFSLPPEPATSVVPQPVPFDIAYQDDFAAVLDKPAGIAVHPTLNYPDGTLANGWMEYLRRNGREGVFRPVNRIDKNTSGLVLCAQNAFAAPILAASAHKCYLALVEGVLDQSSGEIEAPIGRRKDSIIGRWVCPDGKPSITAYRVLRTGGGHSLVACQPVTGRTHQIRVHMAYFGHPLAGDTLYGGHTAIMDRHALHCGVLQFQLPVTGERITVKSPLPRDMAAACTACGYDSAWQQDLDQLSF